MYKIYADDNLIYDSTLEDFVITKGQITKEVNKAGSFVFTIYPSHPYYTKIQELKTIIKVYKHNNLKFRGRVLKIQTGFFKDKTFTCEGELCFLLDSIIRPFSFTGSPTTLFRYFIEEHNKRVDNSKKFELGKVTVIDPNDYVNRSNTAYESTSVNMKSRLLDTLGGYLYITRQNDDMPILNYLDDSPYITGQKIEFGENLLDFTKINDAEEIGTVIIPLGAKLNTSNEDEKRLTIASVNGGVDYIYDKVAVSKYGWIEKVVTYDDVNDPMILLRKAQNDLAQSIKQNMTIEVSAIDLSLLDKNVDSFEVFEYIDIESKPHNLSDRMLLQKQTLDLLKPQNDKITLGYTIATFTDKTINNSNKNDSLIQRVENVENNSVTNSVVSAEIEKLQSLINQSSQQISSEISQGYVSNDKLIAEVSTIYAQLKDSFDFMFKNLQTTVEENNKESQTQFTEIKKHIKFEDGNIILKTSDSDVTLKIEKDTIAFYQNDVQVAYFKNRKLFVNDGEFLSSVQIGKFAFIPRANGNLSFKKVVK